MTNDENLIESVMIKPPMSTHFGSIAHPQSSEGMKVNVVDQAYAEVEKTYNDIWRFEPVDVQYFFRKFLNKNLFKKQRDLGTAICGKDPFSLVPPYRESDIIWGMRSGKNYVTEGIFVYKAYHLLCLIDPLGFLGLTPDRTIDMINITCVNETQARRVFFHNACNTLKKCIDPDTGLNWFHSKYGMDIRDGKDIKKKEMDLPKNIRMCSFNTEADAFQGYNVFFFVGDEISRANTKPRYEKAKEQIKTVIANCKATYPKYGSGVLISYPDNDTIDYGWERYQKNAKNEKVYTDLAKTLEVREDLTEADLKEIFDDDPEFADVAYNCNVKSPETGFFVAHPERISEMMDKNLKPIAKYAAGITTRIIKEDGNVVAKRKYTALHFTEMIAERLVEVNPYDTRVKLRTADDLSEHFRILTLPDMEQRLEEIKAFKERNIIREGSYNKKGEFVGRGKGGWEKILGDNRIRFVACDPGLSGDTYSLVSGYCSRIDEDNRVLAELAARHKILSMPVIDLIMEFKPIKERGIKIPVDFVNVQNIVSVMNMIFPNMKKVSYDHWQSELGKQQLEAEGVQAEVKFFSRKMQYQLYVHFRRVIYSGLIRTLHYPLLEKELKQLLDINHNKVDHPPAGSKDVADAGAQVVKLITDTDLNASGFDWGADGS